ncbi:MAG: hypothetical protein DWQ05_04165 [Calditrichaeota bacterium]|nr:MAG: hypothetical protein DWQ05_04165 [Calditrichota bacterium]
MLDHDIYNVSTLKFSEEDLHELCYPFDFCISHQQKIFDLTDIIKKNLSQYKPGMKDKNSLHGTEIHSKKMIFS